MNLGTTAQTIKGSERKLNASVLSNESMLWLVGHFFLNPLPSNSLFVSFLRNAFLMIKVTRTQKWCLKLPTLNLLIDPVYLSAEQGGVISVIHKINSSELEKSSWLGKHFLSRVKFITELTYPAWFLPAQPQGQGNKTSWTLLFVGFQTTCGIHSSVRAGTNFPE